VGDEGSKSGRKTAICCWKRRGKLGALQRNRCSPGCAEEGNCREGINSVSNSDLKQYGSMGEKGDGTNYTRHMFKSKFRRNTVYL